VLTTDPLRSLGRQPASGPARPAHPAGGARRRGGPRRPAPGAPARVEPPPRRSPAPVDERIEAFSPTSSSRHRHPAAAAAPHPGPGPARAGADLSLPVDADDYSPRSCSRATGSPTASCTTRATTAAPPRASSTSPRVGCRSRTTRRPCPRGLRSPAGARASTPVPAAALELPITSRQPAPGRVLRLAAAAPAGRRRRPRAGTRERRMETRFIVPGGMVANLDFVEGIFGNAGDPYLPENDRRSIPLHWTGHTGCVILAPHLTHVTKQSSASPSRQGDRAADPRRHVLVRPGRALQRRQGLQGVRPRRARRHGHDHRGQLLRLLQERGQDPDLHVRQPFRRSRGGAQRRRHGLPLLGRGARVRQSVCRGITHRRRRRLA
jgi:hypothetical protein